MIPKEVEEAIKDKFPDVEGQILTNAIALSNIDAAKYGYSLAQQSIQDEAIAFAKWVGEEYSLTQEGSWFHFRSDNIYTTAELYTKFKTEQDERNR